MKKIPWKITKNQLNFPTKGSVVSHFIKLCYRFSSPFSVDLFMLNSFASNFPQIFIPSGLKQSNPKHIYISTYIHTHLATKLTSPHTPTFTPHKTLNEPTTHQNYNYNVLLSIVNNQGPKNKFTPHLLTPPPLFLIHLQKLIVQRDKRCNCVLGTASKITPPKILMNF